MECAICHQRIESSQKYVRLIAEEVAKDQQEDIGDPAHWSLIEDFHIIIGVHSDCVKRKLSLGKPFPYSKEIERVSLSCMAGHDIPMFKVVKGTS